MRAAAHQTPVGQRCGLWTRRETELQICSTPQITSRAAAAGWKLRGLPSSRQTAPPQPDGRSIDASRPTGVGEDAQLRLMAEAYEQLMISRSGRRAGVLTEEELGVWLRQLRELAFSGDGDTVLALFSALRAQHS